MNASLVERLVARHPTAIARALSVVETGGRPAAELIAQIGPRAGHAYLVGVTGPPGVGKSTLVDRLIAEFRGAGPRVGVLAIDPTSPFTGGALLGDRVRMQAHAADQDVFIRSMATRGALGGLARSTADAAVVLDAAGFDVILVETIGVGQDEVEVMRAADIVVVVLAPGAGDEIQAGKAGLMEIADIFVINKADRDGADHTASVVEGVLSLGTRPEGAWRAPVVKTVATAATGVSELAAAIRRFRHEASATIDERRRARKIVRAPQTMVIDHVGIAVADPTAFVDFLAGEFSVTSDVAVVSEADRVRVQFLDTDGTRVELVAPTTEDSSISKFLKTRGPGLHHLALRVRDLPATLASLKARGVRLIDEAPRTGAHGKSIAFIHPSSTGGVLIELIAEEERPHDLR